MQYMKARLSKKITHKERIINPNKCYKPCFKKKKKEKEQV